MLKDKVEADLDGILAGCTANTAAGKVRSPKDKDRGRKKKKEQNREREPRDQNLIKDNLNDYYESPQKEDR